MKFLLPLLLLGSLVSQCYSQPGELYYSQEIIKSDDANDAVAISLCHILKIK